MVPGGPTQDMWPTVNQPEDSAWALHMFLLGISWATSVGGGQLPQSQSKVWLPARRGNGCWMAKHKRGFIVWKANIKTHIRLYLCILKTHLVSFKKKHIFFIVDSITDFFHTPPLLPSSQLLPPPCPPGLHHLITHVHGLCKVHKLFSLNQIISTVLSCYEIKSSRTIRPWMATWPPPPHCSFLLASP